jgi:anti-sigma regulatory factor (Ser/Thr protein kinase)
MSAEGAGPASELQIARIGLAAERDYLAAALGFLREIAGQLGLGTPDVAGLARAIEEVCLNVIEHGFEPGESASFDVVILRRPGQLVVAVEDRGLPFDWSRLEGGAGSALAAPSLTAGSAAASDHIPRPDAGFQDLTPLYV